MEILKDDERTRIVKVMGIDDPEMMRKLTLIYNFKNKNEYYDVNFIKMYDNFLLEKIPGMYYARRFIRKMRWI